MLHEDKIDHTACGEDTGPREIREEPPTGTDYTQNAYRQASSLMLQLERMESSGQDVWDLIHEESEWNQKCLAALEEIAKNADLPAYVRRCVYFSDPELEKQPYADIKDVEFRASLLRHFNRGNNAGFSSNKAQYVTDWLSGEKLGRSRLILLALVMDLDAEVINHVLNVKKGEARLSFREPEEAIAQYVLYQHMGYNGYVQLQSEFFALLKGCDAAHKLKALLCKGHGRGQTQFVGEMMESKLEADARSFLQALMAQPLTQYALELQSQLEKPDGMDEDWENAIQREYPELLKEMPGEKRKKLNKKQQKHVETILPGFGVLSRTGLASYENLLARIDIECKKMRTAQKSTGSITPAEREIYRQNLFEGRRIPDGELEAEILKYNVEMLTENPYTLFQNADKGQEEENGKEEPRYLLRNTLPPYLRKSYKTALNAAHKRSVLNRHSPVESNDLVYLYLWLAELEMQLDMGKKTKQGIWSCPWRKGTDTGTASCKT